jgi:hypothetical protein
MTQTSEKQLKTYRASGWEDGVVLTKNVTAMSSKTGWRKMQNDDPVEIAKETAKLERQIEGLREHLTKVKKALEEHYDMSWEQIRKDIDIDKEDRL